MEGVILEALPVGREEGRKRRLRSPKVLRRLN
jgi:hypothetical protein